MPTRPPVYCSTPGCPNTTTLPPRCPPCQTAATAAWKTKSSRIYNTRRWQVARRYQLATHPWCQHPGCRHPATEVDHIRRINDGGQPFDPTNLQSLCKPHHSTKTAHEIRLGHR